MTGRGYLTEREIPQQDWFVIAMLAMAHSIRTDDLVLIGMQTCLTALEVEGGCEADRVLLQRLVETFSRQRDELRAMETTKQ